MRVLALLLVAMSLFADDALDQAIKKKLGSSCGLRIVDEVGFSDPYNKSAVYLGEITLAATKHEEELTKGLLGWAASIKDSEIRSAYLRILYKHEQSIQEALREFDTREWTKLVERLQRESIASIAKSQQIALPDPPCHTTPQKAPVKK